MKPEEWTYQPEGGLTNVFSLVFVIESAFVTLVVYVLLFVMWMIFIYLLCSGLIALFVASRNSTSNETEMQTQTESPSEERVKKSNAFQEFFKNLRELAGGFLSAKKQKICPPVDITE